LRGQTGIGRELRISETRRSGHGSLVAPAQGKESDGEKRDHAEHDQRDDERDTAL
jgi:hypothetical protein